MLSQEHIYIHTYIYIIFAETLLGMLRKIKRLDFLRNFASHPPILLVDSLAPEGSVYQISILASFIQIYFQFPLILL